MDRHQYYESSTEALVLPILSQYQYELVDIEYVKEAGSWHLRVYIDKEGGITIEDLTKVNHELSSRMDEEDFIQESYILEVSSPGLTRPFKKMKDFQRNIGNLIEIHLYSPFTWEENGKKLSSKELEGTLIEADEESITVEFEEEERITFLRKNISLVRKAIDF